MVLSRPSCDAEQAGDFAEGPFQAPLGARAVVADDVHDQRVVEFAGRFQAVDQPADVVVGELHVRRVVLHQSSVDFLLVRRAAVPRRNAFMPRRELRPLGDDAHLQLLGVRQLALLVPAVVELAPVLVAPFLGGLMRGVDARGAEVGEPGLIRIGGARVLDPGDGLVGHVGGEVVALLRRLRLSDRRGVAVKRGVVLVRLPLVEAVEVVEALAGRPEVERAGGADLGLGRVVRLAEHRRGVAVVAEDLRDQRRALGDDPGVPGVAGAHLDDDAGADAVVVASGEQRRARSGCKGPWCGTGCRSARSWRACPDAASGPGRRTSSTCRTRRRRARSAARSALPSAP